MRRILTILFLCALAALPATVTWSAAGAGNWSTGANWSGGSKPAAGDDVVFDATSVQNCTVDEAPANLNSFTMSNYSGVFNAGSYNWTIAGAVAITLHASQTFTSSGTWTQTGDANFTMNRTGTRNISGMSIVLQGTGNYSMSGALAWEAPKYLECAYSGKTTTLSVSTVVRNSANIVRLKGGTLALGANTLYIVPTASMTDPWIIDANTSITNANGGWQLDAGANSITVSVPAVNIGTSQGIVWLQSSGSTYTGVVYNCIGNITGSAVHMQNATGGVTYNLGSITITGALRTGVQTSGTSAWNYQTCTANITLYNNSYNAGTQTHNLGTATFNCAGNWTWGNNAGTTVNPGTSVVNITDASTITSNGKPFYDIVVNAGTTKTVTLADSLQCHTKTRTSGKVKDAGNNIRLSGDLTINGTDSVVATGRRTFTGTTASVSYGSNNTAVDASGVTFAFSGNGTLHFGKRGISRLICTGGKTYTWTAGDSVGIANHTSGNWNGTAGNLVTWTSTGPYKVYPPNDVSVSYMDVKYCRNQGDTIDVSDGTSTNSRYNMAWRFPPKVYSPQNIRPRQTVTVTGYWYGLNTTIAVGDSEITPSVKTDTTATITAPSVINAKWLKVYTASQRDSIAISTNYNNVASAFRSKSYKNDMYKSIAFRKGTYR